MKENTSSILHPIISGYMPLVDFLGKLIGPHCEVVLHDLTRPEHSVVRIANGHISGRRIGAPLTDFSLRMVKNKAHANADFIHEYEGILKSGKRVRSSTFFIKDDSGELIGFLCFNMDMTCLKNLHEALDTALETYFNYRPDTEQSLSASLPNTVPKHSATPHGDSEENFSESIEDLMNISISKALAPYDLPPERLSPQERGNVIEALYQKGFFQLRGAVEYVAASFRLSEATIYRYLKGAQKKHQSE